MLYSKLECYILTADTGKTFSVVGYSEVMPVLPRGGGELPYEEYMGVCHELGSHFQEKNPKRVCQFFTKIPERAIVSVRNSI